ncbi:MAG: hypothetical protein Q9164_000275 [Protoblastenia rupestris]
MPLPHLTRNQVRRLHLLHRLFDHSAGHKEKLGTLRRKSLPSADELTLSLRAPDGHDLGTKTLRESWEFIQPLNHLQQVEAGVYQITPLKRPVMTAMFGRERKSFTRLGRSKAWHLTTTATPVFVAHVLSKAYEFLLRGARIEMHLKQKVNDNDHTVDWALCNAMHLRPESLLAAMPNGTIMLTEPCQNPVKKMADLVWAIEYPPALASDRTPKRVHALAQNLGTDAMRVKDKGLGDGFD